MSGKISDRRYHTWLNVGESLPEVEPPNNHQPDDISPQDGTGLDSDVSRRLNVAELVGVADALSPQQASSRVVEIDPAAVLHYDSGIKAELACMLKHVLDFQLDVGERLLGEELRHPRLDPHLGVAADKLAGLLGRLGKGEEVGQLEVLQDQHMDVPVEVREEETIGGAHIGNTGTS